MLPILFLPLIFVVSWIFKNMSIKTLLSIIKFKSSTLVFDLMMMISVLFIIASTTFHSIQLFIWGGAILVLSSILGSINAAILVYRKQKEGFAHCIIYSILCMIVFNLMPLAFIGM
jgi:hypothetical protein